MTTALVKKVLVLFTIVLTLLVNVVQVNAANAVPSFEITGSAQVPTNICDNNSGGLSFVVPIWYNAYAGSSATGTLSVEGVGTVMTFSDNINTTRNEAWVYGFDGISNYNVAANTLMTATITTYFGPNQTGGVSYISRIVFECDDGANAVITNTAFDAPTTTSVPTINEWGMILFMILAGLGAVYYMRKHRRAES